MKKYFIVILMFSLLGGTSRAASLGVSDSLQESSAPVVGKACPDFVLDNVKYFRKSSVSLKDFRGKWLFLTFWFKLCPTGLKFLPKANAFQKEFKDDIQFLMVGCNNKWYNKNIENLYERLRIKQDLKLAVAFDSVLATNWNIFSMPHIVIVDPDGIVRAITNGTDMNEEKIRNLIEHDEANFFVKDSDDGKFMPEKYFEGSLKTDLLYTSMLTKWSGQYSSVPENIKKYQQYTDSSSFKIGKVPLWELYSYAYFGKGWWNGRRDPHYGKVWQMPLLEMKDSSMFEFDYFDHGYYNFYLKLPKRSTEEEIKRGMQRALETMLGFEAIIEEREMPVYVLKTTDKARKQLLSKGGRKYSSANDAPESFPGFTVKNFPMEEFVNMVFQFVWYNQPPIIDETGIKGNIDITIDAILSDFDQIRSELERNGIEVVQSRKKMKVIVIRDQVIQ